MSAEDIGKYFFLFSIEPPVKLSGFALPSDMKFNYNEDSMATSVEVSAYGNLEDVKKSDSKSKKVSSSTLITGGRY
jgi:hypothetical protein